MHPGAGNQSGTLVNALIAHCGASLSGIGGSPVRGSCTGSIKTRAASWSWQRRMQPTGGSRPSLPIMAAKAKCAGSIARSSGRAKSAFWPDRDVDREALLLAYEDDGCAEWRPVADHKLQTEHTFRVPAQKTASKGKGNNSLMLSVVRCSLETGRTHQVRVHMAHIGTPIVGDLVYGAGFRTKASALPEKEAQMFMSMERQALHAFSLRLKHPITGKIELFQSALPEDIAKLCRALESLEAKLSEELRCTRFIGRVM